MSLDLLAQTSKSLWLPQGASTYSDEVDWLFYFIMGVVGFFTLLILVLMVWFAWRYRGKPGQPASSQTSHGTLLELTWTFIPLVLVIVIFVLGLKGFMDMSVIPANTYDIGVTAVKWSWSFTYPNGTVAEELHVPLGRPIRLIMGSQDVIHSFYVPVLRLKKDVVPGRYTQIWFQANTVNEDDGFDIFCAEYCGTNHSQMISKLYVHESSRFNRWLEEASNWEKHMSPLERGKDIYVKRGCMQCHTTDGSKLIGPTFKDLWTEIAHGGVVFKDGKKLSDYLGPEYSPEQYVRESITKPAEKLVAGYDNVMPSFAGQLKDNDLNAIIAYLKDISGVAPDTATASQPADSGPH